MNKVEPLRTRRDIKALRNLLWNKNPRDGLLFVLGINSGLRVSDLLSLCVGDVIAGNGTRLQVAKTITLREQKTGKRRSFPLNDSARKALREYFTIESPTSTDPLFPSRKRNEKGERHAITRWTAWKKLKEAASNLGIDSIGTHSMRKSFGYHLYKEGINITRIQAMLNHASPETTLAYIGITDDELHGYYRGINL